LDFNPWMMHKFSTASTRSPALPVLRDPQAGAPDLLNVPSSTFALTSVAHLVRPALSPFRDENLCMIPAGERGALRQPDEK
jgi:hypothetical protein